ncbi:hypothetical protein [Shewanella sp. ISTPL2]|uniref:hypothetical protein n=1 Tax=Shewanella sp. ISTPL2 TaxID=2699425 RepID=UPI0015698089|nr:hypothetical protein [Shewanella sp. ISTPL2]
MANIKKININNLLLDIGNPRFPNEVETQREAISTMLNLPRMSVQIMKLAKDIAENGLDPSENLIVYESEDEPGFYVVAEGNRRLTVLKLLANPEIAPDDKFVSQFKKLKQISKKTIVSVDCHVDEDSTYERWVELKHTGQNEGVSRVGWTTLEQENYTAKHGKQSQQLQIFKFIEAQQDGFEDIIKRKTDLKLTNIARIFGDSKVKKAFALKLIDGYLYCEQPFSHFRSCLKIVLDAMLEKDPDGKGMFTVNRIRSSDDRIAFVHELGIAPSSTILEKPWKVIDSTMYSDSIVFSSGDDKTKIESTSGNDDGSSNDVTNHVRGQDNVEKTTNGEGNDEASGNPSDKPSNKSKPIAKHDRDSLIPANVKLEFHGNKKCSRVFVELKSHLTYKHTINSVSIMLRVFIELSVASYIDRKGLKFKDATRTPGLHDKVIMCCESLRDDGHALSQKQVSAILAYSKSTTNAKGTLHQYVHNDYLMPNKNVLNADWDNFEPLLSAIWS